MTHMTRIVSMPISDLDDALVVLDRGRRLYAAQSRDGSYWHVISPLQVDRLNSDGEVLRAAGALGCICKGATFHGACYQQLNAEALEAANPIPFIEPDWLTPRAALEAGSATFDAPAGAGEMVEAWRG